MLALFVLSGCHREKDPGWACERSGVSGPLSARYRCDRVALQAGDVFRIELDVIQPLGMEEPSLDLALPAFAIVAAHTLPSEWVDAHHLQRRYRWTLQAIAPRTEVTHPLSIVVGAEEGIHRLQLPHAPLSVSSILSENSNPQALPTAATSIRELTP